MASYAYEQFELKKFYDKAEVACRKLKQMNPKFTGQVGLDLNMIECCNYYLSFSEERNLINKYLQSEQEHMRIRARFTMISRAMQLNDVAIYERNIKAIATSLENGKYLQIAYGTQCMNELHMVRMNWASMRSDKAAFFEELKKYIQFLEEHEGL